jgi:hypothetical protein
MHGERIQLDKVASGLVPLGIVAQPTAKLSGEYFLRIADSNLAILCKDGGFAARLKAVVSATTPSGLKHKRGEVAAALTGFKVVSAGQSVGEMQCHGNIAYSAQFTR